MAKPATHTSFVLLSPETVWNLLTDFRRWAEWMPGVTRVTCSNYSEIGRGSLLEVTFGQRAAQVKIDYWEPGKKLQTAILSGPYKGSYCYILQAEHDGTHLTIEIKPLSNGKREHLLFICFSSPSRKCQQQAAALQQLLNNMVN